MTDTHLFPRASDGKHLSLSHQQAEDLHDLYFLTRNIAKTLSGSQNGLPFLRAPLQLSLLISPLFLLIPSQLHKKSYSRQVMLATSERLETKKPAALLAVEKVIWKVVFTLANGCHNPTQLLKSLAHDLPWGEINQLSQDEKCWFSISESRNNVYSIRIYSPLVTNELASKAVGMPTSANSAVEFKQLDEDELSSMSFMTSPSKRDPTLEISLLSASTKLLTTNTSDLDEEPPFTPPVSGTNVGIGCDISPNLNGCPVQLLRWSR